MKSPAESNAKVLNKKFKDIRMKTVDHADTVHTIVRNPNTVMNDYTKNISQSIFSPGIYKNPNKLNTVKLAKRFKPMQKRQSAFEN